MNGHFQIDWISVKDNLDFPEVGIFTSLDEEVYHDLEGRVTSSILRAIHNKTPAHAKAQLESDDDRAVISFCGRSPRQPNTEPGDPLDYQCPYCEAVKDQPCVTKSGNATSPHEARRNLAVSSVEMSDGEVGIEWKADETDLSHQKADKIESMQSKLEGHSAASHLLFEWPGLNELTIIFEYDDGEHLQAPAKARIDRIVKHPQFGMLAVDYMTTRNAQPGPHNFGRSIDRRRYDMQGKFYVHACRAMDIPVRGFVIVAQEKEPPYEVSCHLFPMEGHQYIDDTEVADLQNAERDVKSALRQWIQCAATGEWPGYPDPIVLAEVPSSSDVGASKA